LEGRARRGDYFSILALAQLDPKNAQPLVDALANSKEWKRGLEIRLQIPETRAAAVRRLLEVYGQRNGDGSESAAAAHLLLSYDWEGRNDFFFRLLEDPYWTSLDAQTYPIDGFVRAHSELVPRLVQLVQDPRPSVHNNAVLALLSVGKEKWSQAALAALLPWLDDSQWSNLGASERATFIRALGENPIQGSVPGLLRLVANSHDQQEVYWAVAALESYEPPELPTACQQALTKVSSLFADRVAEIGLRHGYYSVQEQVDAIASLIEEEYGKDFLEIVRARYGQPHISPRKALALAVESAKASPTLSKGLVHLAQDWRRRRRPELAGLDKFLLDQPGHEVDAYLVSRLDERGLSADFLARLLAKSERLRHSSLPELRDLATTGGTGAGLAVIILDDASLTERSLARGSAEEITALIASARFLNRPINLVSLEAGVARIPSLRSAALAYLDAFPSEAARQLAVHLNPGAVITGLRAGDKDFDSVETEMMVASREHSPGSHLYSLQSKSHDQWENLEIWLNEAQGELIHRKRIGPQEPFERRELTQSEVQKVRAFLENREVLEWGEWRANSGTTYQFLDLSSSRGRRMTMRLDSRDPNGPSKNYRELVELFESLARIPTPTIYPALANIPGARVLESHRPTMTIFGDEDGLKVFSSDKSEGYDWRILGPQGVTGRAEAPNYEKNLLPRPYGDRWGISLPLPDHSYLNVTNEEVYLRKEGQRKRHLLKGRFGSPTLNPEGTLCLLQSPIEEGWGGPNSLIILDLSNGMIRPVDIPAAQTLEGVAYLPLHHAFLVQRNEDEAFPAKPANHWYLVDATSAKVTAVTGEFRPWMHERRRPLQSAGGTCYWVALPGANGTIVGIADAQTFKFRSRAEYPGIHFSERAMWVQDGVVYAAVGDDILSLPIDTTNSGRP